MHLSAPCEGGDAVETFLTRVQICGRRITAGTVHIRRYRTDPHRASHHGQNAKFGWCRSLRISVDPPPFQFQTSTAVLQSRASPRGSESWLVKSAVQPPRRAFLQLERAHKLRYLASWWDSTITCGEKHWLAERNSCRSPTVTVPKTCESRSNILSELYPYIQSLRRIIEVPGSCGACEATVDCPLCPREHGRTTSTRAHLSVSAVASTWLTLARTT